MNNFYRAVFNWLWGHKKLVIIVGAAGVLVPTVMVIACQLIISPYGKYIYTSEQQPHVAVGIVLGAGITSEGKPFKELQDRLDLAAAALQAGKVDKLLLSGDNRFPRYNEPEAMRKYLTDTKQVPGDKLQEDYAGRSTYESCERAAKVFAVQQAVIFSATSHLPRAIFLCRHFGVETYGVGSRAEANNSWRREPVARVKAVFNAYVYGEQTILGAPIQF